jgi:hypothetical protein
MAVVSKLMVWLGKRLATVITSHKDCYLRYSALLVLLILAPTPEHL